MLEERQESVRIKTLLMQCYIAEAKFAVFLTRIADTFSSNLQLDDLLRMKDMSDRISAVLAEIKVEQDTPPDKLPVYPIGGVCYLGTG